MLPELGPMKRYKVGVTMGNLYGEYFVKAHNPDVAFRAILEKFSLHGQLNPTVLMHAAKEV